MKEELIVGAWYKSKHNNYFKFEKTENDWNYYSERIIDNIWTGLGGFLAGAGRFGGGGLDV